MSQGISAGKKRKIESIWEEMKSADAAAVNKKLENSLGRAAQSVRPVSKKKKSQVNQVRVKLRPDCCILLTDALDYNADVKGGVWKLRWVFKRI